jgi:ribosomal protein S18 acetylase RimI-like enzyme
LLVRPARPGDVRRLAAVHVASWQEAYRGILPDEVLAGLSVDRSELTWQQHLADPVRQNYVCELGGALVGFVAVGPSRDPDTNPARTGELYRLYVDPVYWRRGVGRALWQQALAGLRALGYDDAILWVFEANDQARRFYERAGFGLEAGVTRRVERYGVAPLEVRYRWPLGQAVPGWE